MSGRIGPERAVRAWAAANGRRVMCERVRDNGGRVYFLVRLDDPARSNGWAFMYEASGDTEAKAWRATADLHGLSYYRKAAP